MNKAIQLPLRQEVVKTLRAGILRTKKLHLMTKPGQRLKLLMNTGYHPVDRREITIGKDSDPHSVVFSPRAARPSRSPQITASP